MEYIKKVNSKPTFTSGTKGVMYYSPSDGVYKFGPYIEIKHTDGTVTYDYVNNTSHKEDLTIEAVTIFGKDTIIQSHQFNNCTNLKRVNIKYGVKTISAWAFVADGIENLTIPNSVTAIGWYAFTSNHCEKIEIPSSVTILGQFCLGQASNGKPNYYTKEIVLNEGLITIEEGVFQHCAGLNVPMKLPSTLTSIGNATFNDTALTELYYNGTIEAWNNITKGEGSTSEAAWHGKTIKTVHCTDGDVSITW